jgi:hypothetical protein
MTGGRRAGWQREGGMMWIQLPPLSVAISHSKKDILCIVKNEKEGRIIGERN